MKPVIFKPQKHPMPDRQQRRYLLQRLEKRLDELNRHIWKWHEQQEKEAPAEVQAALKVIGAWEDQLDSEKRKKHTSVNLVMQWTKEQLMFQPREVALSLMKRLEGLTLEEIEAAGATMEDRNDLPIGILPQDLAALPPSHR